MKTRDLINALQAADPSGEIECCVGNQDVHFVSREPSYWDGCLQVYERDESQSGCWNIRGVRRTANGEKIQIHSYSVDDLLGNDPNLPIVYEGMSPEKEERYRTKDEQSRSDALNFEAVV